MKNLVRVSVSAIILLFTPSQALAAKASDSMVTPSKPMVVEPVSVQKVPTTKSVKPIMVNPNVDIKQAQPAVKLPVAAKVNTIKKPAVPNVKPATRTIPADIGKLPAVQKTDNINAIREANQARDLGAAKDAAEAARNIPGMVERSDAINPDLGLAGDKGPDLTGLPGHDGGVDFSDPTGRLPVIPSNQDKGGLSGAPTGPLSPKEAMEGSAEIEGRIVRLDGPGPKVRTITTTESSTLRYADRSVVTHVHRRPDGSYTVQDVTHHNNGTVTSRARNYDKEGYHDPATDDTTQDITPSDGDDGGIAGLQGTEGGSRSGAWARYGAKISGQQPDLSLKNPNQVNPGRDAAAADPKAPQLMLPEDQLVINPDPDAAGGAGRTPDQRTAEMLRRQVEAGAGPGVRPPEPSNSDAFTDAQPDP